ncbi:MAG TPA: TlpA disulfide reductase family protein [Solirubrobacteraceae bacterium]|jgi:cytochrome c biogenesis protein CcmG/thiol:disulfide interchange protein DsbE|nr:TlpA disulfide reductase family protein [Solirubrobacteraceae bacterium]
MSARRLLAILAGLAVVALVAVGLTQLPGSASNQAAQPPLTAARQRALLAGSPPALAALHRQWGALLDPGSGGRALRARLAALKGYPVVVNKWASWCVPCRAEFGAFQRVAAIYGRRVAFLGLDSGDSSRSDALAFLRGHPVSYPSYYDANGALGLGLTDSSFTPVTVFLPVHGQPFIYQGQIPSASKLEQEVERYALDG